jgi:hemolysin activation/secretion protein
VRVQTSLASQATLPNLFTPAGTTGLLALLCLGWLSPVLAQPVSLPDAGSLQRETERSLQAPGAAPQLRPAAPMPQQEDPQAPRVTVSGFAIEGAQLLPEPALQALLADLLGQALSMRDLEQAVARIDRAYRDAGWYARVWLPPQDVSQGLVRIQVLEGRFGSASVQPAGTPLRADAAAVQRTVTAGLQEGQPLSASRLERGLLLANDLAGIAATAVLQAGQATGSSDLHIEVTDQPLLTGDVAISNYGLRTTGKGQLSGGLAVNNLSGRGDQLALRMLGSAHLGSVQARYSLPLGYDGLRLALWGSAMGYKLAGSYSALDAKGQAYSAGIGLSYPLLRQQARNLQLDVGLQHRRYDDDMLDTAVRRQRNEVFNLGLSGDLSDSLGGGGINWGSVQLLHGRLRMQSSTGEITQDAAGPNTRGNYTKLAWQANRLQNLQGWLGQGWQLQASASGQWANHNLGSAERMGLGGPDQVRAYPVNEAMGDEGLVLKLQLQRELGSALGGGWQAQLFYDWGQIRQHHTTWQGWDGGRGMANRYHLAGWGLGLRWSGQGAWRGWQLQASVATPVGNNPAASQGRNSDGSSQRSSRGWLVLSRSF